MREGGENRRRGAAAINCLRGDYPSLTLSGKAGGGDTPLDYASTLL